MECCSHERLGRKKELVTGVPEESQVPYGVVANITDSQSVAPSSILGVGSFCCMNGPWYFVVGESVGAFRWPC
ncbi:hypothetical protein HYQ44_000649 [Verticillium longisporum]|nr:hypothetical protein HYQ44_000649 [Verticillium longisporum]